MNRFCRAVAQHDEPRARERNNRSTNTKRKPPPLGFEIAPH